VENVLIQQKIPPLAIFFKWKKKNQQSRVKEQLYFA
jgi:hypothetical protein